MTTYGISEADLEKFHQSYTYQTINGGRHYYDPTQNYVNYGFGRVPIGDPIADLQSALANSVGPAPVPPQFKFTFDTIGQTIVRSIGNCRLLIKPIWALGIIESGDTTISNTQTFAGAVCAPIDPLEEGEIGRVWAGGSLIFNSGEVVAPSGWSAGDAALLAASLSSIVQFPGNEAQLPATLIVADKGADRTNAFRGIRYFIFPNYPIKNGGLPQLSVEFLRTNSEPEDTGAVEFLPGES
jgi:hypothetical protein